MNYIDLFHGIGGFALGAYWAGMKFENHFCSDIEPYCTWNIYKLRFPDSIQLGDITKIDTEELRKIWRRMDYHRGIPLPRHQHRREGTGITGARSGLWFKYWRLIRDLQPRFAIMENVGALTFRGLDAVLGSLSEIGYNAEWQNISAKQIGAWHCRERLWIVAYSNGGGWNAIKIYDRTTSQNKGVSRQHCYSISKTFQKISESDFASEVNGISGELDEFKGLGNAIVPQIAELLFRQIKPYIEINNHEN
jgi:DNA (cytosine-5)-methyltransferase 1